MTPVPSIEQRRRDAELRWGDHRHSYELRAVLAAGVHRRGNSFTLAWSHEGGLP